MHQLLEQLDIGPARIAEIVTGLTAAQLRTAPAPDQWSANELLAHLRCCADVWGSYIRRILDEDAPTIRVVSPRGWITRTNYLDLEFAESLHAFRLQRSELLAELNSLTASQWARTAIAKASHKTVTSTVLDYAERLATHEHHHFDQFVRIAHAMRS